MIGIVILVVYTAIMLTATLLFTKRSEGEDFHVGNRKMGTFPSAMSIAATWIWAPALLVSAENAYKMGIPGLFWFVVPNVLCLMLFIPFAKKIREKMQNGITLSGFMGTQYKSTGVKRVYGFQLSFLAILSTAVQLLAGGSIVSKITGLPFILVTIILAAIAFSYSQFSGIRASVLTDVIQMALILAGCALMVPWALGMHGGVNNLVKGLGGITGEFRSLLGSSGWSVFISTGLATTIGLISGPFGDQCFWQRAFSIKKEKIGRSFFLGAILFGIVPLSMGALGFIAAGSGMQAENTGLVNFELIGKIFPAWVMVPFLFMMVSGLLSTIDSNLCAVASLTTDLKESKPRIAMVALLAAGICVASIPGLTVSKLFLIYGTLRATTLLPTVLTLCDVNLNKNGVIAGVITALCTGLPLFSYATLNGLSVWKSVFALYTVLISGTIAFVWTLASRKEAVDV